MWKFCSIILVVTIFSRSSLAQTATVASTQYGLSKIVSDLVNQENRVKGAIATAQTQVNAAITALQGVAAAADIVAALTATKNFLTNAATVNDYGSPNVTLSCSNLPGVAAGIQFNVRTCYSINSRCAGNSTFLMSYRAQINAAYQLKMSSLSASQNSAVQAALTALASANNAYVQYTAALVTAVVSYSMIYVQLLFLKKNVCSCPANLPTTAVSTMSTIDSTIASVQTSVAAAEAKIIADAKTLASKIATTNADLKTNSALVSISNTLDTILTLVSGLFSLNTFVAANSTKNCDDAAITIALVQYKLAQYYKTNIEVATNATYLLYNLGLLNTYYVAQYTKLSGPQIAGIEAVKTAINTLLEDFRQYMVALVAGWAKLLPLVLQCQTASAGCACSGGSGGGATDPETTPSEFAHRF